MPGEQLLKALDHVWKVLTPMNVPMAVMGGIAVSVWQHARSTRDVDILIQMAPSDTGQKWLEIWHEAFPGEESPLHFDGQP